MSKNTGGGVKAKLTVSEKKQIFFREGFPQSVSHPFPQLTLRSRSAFLGLPAASNHEIDYVTQVKEILNLKGNHNSMIDSKVG